MDDLVLVKKMTAGERNQLGMNIGRPNRTTFALRHYSEKSFMLAIPSQIVQPGDGVEFFMSSTGFAIQLSPEGSRKLSGKRGASTANIPLEVRQHLSSAPAGSIDLNVVEEMPNRTWFFPFSQISA